MVSYEERVEIVQYHGVLEQPLQWRFNLLFDIVVEIDRNILHKHLTRILSIFEVLRSLHSLNHYVRNTVTYVDILTVATISLLHFLSKFDMSLLNFVCVFGLLFLGILFILLIIRFLSDCLSNHQFSNVDLVLKQLRYFSFDVFSAICN